MKEEKQSSEYLEPDENLEITENFNFHLAKQPDGTWKRIDL